MNRLMKTWLLIVLLMEICRFVKAQVNRSPHFALGGDMARFSILEDTAVGTIVYKLQGVDPENTNVFYSISGQHFTVNKHTGDVTLIKALDRELYRTLEVVISLTDEAVYGADANTVSIRREIPVLDINDNAPIFMERPYSFSLSESTKIGSVIYSNISIIDKDLGVNSDIVLSCISGEICKIFRVMGDKMSDGIYRGIITLSKSLDYEVQSSYSLVLKATDSNPKFRLTSTATVAIEVQDVQDQPPVFLNTPYSISVQENTQSGVKVLIVDAKDGDVENRRPVTFTLDSDSLHYFKLVNFGNNSAAIVTSDIPIDREHPYVAQNGGIYTFNIKATELINNELPGEESIEPVTIVVLDVDDQLPVFNYPKFHLNVSENIGIGTPLPGLGMVVSDNDFGENGRFSLELRLVREDEESLSRVYELLDDKWFSLEPITAVGRTPVVIRVLNNSGLDFDVGITTIPLTVVAFVNKNGVSIEVASSDVLINLLDANDNTPEFKFPNYTFHLSENSDPGILVANITATDRDSGIYSEITYSLFGFGVDKFTTDEHLGGLFLTSNVDFETQVSYSLTLEAKDGGGRSSTVNILVLVDDVNDNIPKFEKHEYHRIVRDGIIAFEPKFFVKASDMDSGENGNIVYTVQSSNSNAIVLDKITGELSFISPSNPQHTTNGQYELKIRATDRGKVPLHSDVNVFIRVGVPGNQRPIFEDQPYSVTIPETASVNSPVLTIKAVDPDGADNSLEYRITAGGDNFKIDSKSGLISVSEEAVLDFDKSSQYELSVMAMDNGLPFPEISETKVYINISDVNNKPPHFSQNNVYISHISEKLPLGTTVLKLEATDPDMNSEIEYNILLNTVKVTDSRGISVNNPKSLENWINSFRIEKKTGQIMTNNTLDHQIANLVVFTVEAKDINAVENLEMQFDTAEVMIYIEAINALNPVFTVGGWTPINPFITINVFEELPIGSTILQLMAQESSGLPVNNFEPKSGLPNQINVDRNGKIFLTKRLDYETLEQKTMKFSVRALTSDSLRSTEAFVILNVIDINDHAPQFPVDIYRGSIKEDSKKGATVITVAASDGDLVDSPYGFATIHYTLFGEHAFLFKIDNTTGIIMVAENGSIDREHVSILNMIVVAADTPIGGKNQRTTSVKVQIDVLDINDNAPIFNEPAYSTVVLENVDIGTSIINVSAVDSDFELAGLVNYEIINEFDIPGLFVINATSGEIKTAKRLTGRGRNEPYTIDIRAQDNGEPSLFTDITVSILIGDIVSNDGVPIFLHPTPNEVAYISENSSIRSPVFKVIATDPDDPFTPAGRIKYMFLPNGNDSAAFHIDEDTGLITTRIVLDREIKSQYVLVIIAKDSGAIAQEATRVLPVIVSDIDDNMPSFKRSLDEPDLEMFIQEEVPVGTKVGILEAVDIDEGENAKIGFVIIDGNEDNLFTIEEISNHGAAIVVSKRLDREIIDSVILTIKCYRFNSKPTRLRKEYNKSDFTERKVMIKILDIDDNVPKFDKNNITIGVRSNITPGSLILKLNASDVDISSEPIFYHLENFTYNAPDKNSSLINNIAPFRLKNETGEIFSNSSMEIFTKGYFSLYISASNNASQEFKSLIFIKLLVVRERNLFKFVFSKKPAEVQEYMDQFREEIENVLALPSSAQLNIIDSRYLLRQDGSLDLSKTGSCFQFMSENANTTRDLEAQLVNLQNNEKLKEIYEKYHVHSIQRCGLNTIKFGLTSIQMLFLGVGTFLTALSFFLICFLCCSCSRWRRLR